MSNYVMQICHFMFIGKDGLAQYVACEGQV